MTTLTQKLIDAGFPYTSDLLSKMDCFERFAASILPAESLAEMFEWGKDAGRREEREKFYEIESQLKTWREAYPLSIFPTPDWEKVRDALEINGLTLDAVSAANIRHAIKIFEEMIEETIRARGQS